MHDTINFLGKLSIRKAWNLLLVQFSFFLSGILRRPIVWGKPWFVSIEPSSVCNLACPQCPVGEGDISRGNNYLSLEEYSSLLGEIAPTTTLLSLYFQGEPIMHKQFTDFIKLASEQGIYTQTSTNGQLLSTEICRGLVQAGLDRIIVSVDGLDQESYEEYRKGGNFEKVKEGIRNLVNTRKELGSKAPLVILQFLVFKHNEHQLPEVKEMADQLGADRHWIKTAQIEYPETAGQWIPETPGYARYEKNSRSSTDGKDKGKSTLENNAESPDKEGEWKLKGKQMNRCKRLWQTTVVCSDGLIVPCCFDKRAQYPMGKSGTTGLAIAWKSKKYQDFRKQVLRDRKSIDICRNCTEGLGRIYR